MIEASEARFAEALAAIWPEAARPRDWTLGLAVSGGPDSLALLVLAAAAFPGRVEAATVDHGLRAESAAEAALVAQVCADRNVPHATLAVTVAEGNLQAEARAARYAALAQWLTERGLSALATAHHADDQAETLLMRLNRGSGAAGLAGVRARAAVPGNRLPLLRPLLGFRRAELAAVVQAAGIDPVDDPSNTDDRFDRARLRKALVQADWLDVPSLAESATHLADASAALEWAAAREWSECVTEAGTGITYRPSAPRAVALLVLARIVARLDGEPARGSALARLFDTLLAGRPASIGGLLARPSLEGWNFARAPKRRSV